MTGALSWERDGAGWPNRSASRFVAAGGLRWHVQVAGSGPVVLLVHGTGASTHSWRRLLPLLAASMTVVAPDLPGHGFTTRPTGSSGLSLPGMAQSVGDLVEALALAPQIVVGHSAGAAILVRATLDRRMDPAAIVSLNGALLPFGSWAGRFFSPLAKLMAASPLMPRVMAWRAASRAAVAGVIEGTGSKIPAEDMDIYARLFRNPAHVAAALGMMANWDLAAFARDLPRLATPLVLVAGGADAAIPADDAFRVRDVVPTAEVRYLREIGHLAHEEDPELIRSIILEVGRRQAVLAPG